MFIAVSIYSLQKKHEKQQIVEAIKRDADAFLINNSDEIEYLPLCIIAANVDKYAKHNRTIYSNFIRCREELQDEVLYQMNYPKLIFEAEGWVNNYLTQFVEMADENKLGKSMLYGGHKYFHRTLESYREESVEGIDENVFENPNPDLCNSMLRKSSLTRYIDGYLEFTLRDREDTKESPEKLPQLPPFDHMWEELNLADIPEKMMCYWTMKSVYSSVIAFHRHEIIKNKDEDWRQLPAGDARIETFEDVYYQVLLELYVSFSPSRSKVSRRSILMQKHSH